MTETAHTRSRRASLGGLLVQLIAFAGTFTLSFVTNSLATYNLAWYILGGVPIWFVALLVFRQRELAALEALDLEELRREKQRTGGGEAMFAEGGAAGLAFRVAEARLKWMQRWLIPSFGLVTAVYLAVMGILLWRVLTIGATLGAAEPEGFTIGGPGWPTLTNIPVALVIMAILMLGTFLLSRYTSGMGRAKEWQLLRGCGSYLLGNSLLITALMICLGIAQYTGSATWEQTLAFIVPALMFVLAVEMFANFVLDIYRPRAPGVEPRACFDSRLLGLIAEPGGIAKSVADALNYQFGFQVSQTWFYQLLERAFAPLMAAGMVAIWLLTSVVIVQPYEHVIIERFGRQLNPGGEDAMGNPLPRPYGPGLHVKWPWPIDVARSYNTGQLQQLSVGFLNYDATPKYDDETKPVMLWTDDKHMGLRHFDFLTCPKPESDGDKPPPARLLRHDEDEKQREAAPVHMIRMEVVIQYRTRAEELHRFTQAMIDPRRAIRDISWEEIVRFNASSTVDYLMGEELAQVGDILRERLTERVRPLGLEVVYVGVANVHPERTVAEAYREVIGAEQEKLASIQEAWVTENQRLSAVAGDAVLASRLATTIERAREASEHLNTATQALRTADPAAIGPLRARLQDVESLFLKRIAAAARLEDAWEHEKRVAEDYKLGLGQTLEMVKRTTEAVARAEAEHESAGRDLEQALAPLRAEMAPRLSPAEAAALIEQAAAQVARAHWTKELDQEFGQTQLGGEAARQLADASADRWEAEMKPAGELARVRTEREAYLAAPEVYKTRRLMDVLVEGLKDARKFFLAFDPGERLVRVRFVAEDQPALDTLEWSGEQREK